MGGGLRAAAPLVRRDNKTIADHLAAWGPNVFRPWLWTRTLRRWLEENKKEGREPRDACDVLIPILREKCDRVGEAGVPISAPVMQPIFNRVAEQHGMTRRNSDTWIRHFLRSAGFKYRVASGGTQRTKDPKLLDTHMGKLRWRLMYFVMEYKVRPSCIINMDETTANFLGLGQRGWAKPNKYERVRFIGAEDKRNLTILTVVTMTGTITAQLIVEGAMKRVVQDLPENVSDRHECTERTCQELIEWLGAWVRKQGFLHWVLLWDCASVHQKASLMEWIRTAPRALHSGWLHSEAATCGHLNPAALQAHHQTAGHAILCRICVPGGCGARPEPRHHETPHGDVSSARLHRGGKKHGYHNEGLAPPLVDIRRGTNAWGESRSRAPQWHTLR